MKTGIENQIRELFKKWSSEEVEKIQALPPSGSHRKYYRASSKNTSAIATYNSDIKENKAFLSFSDHFIKKGLNVPEIYAVSDNEELYLQQDLGDITLFEYLKKLRVNGSFPNKVLKIYKQVIKDLPYFQIKGSENINFSLCYPHSTFGKKSMMWDLNYFKYNFLKLAQIPFDENSLELDFEVFTEFLLGAEMNYFLYRDFQSRNVMIFNNQPYYIDYQGGRKGALQYDLASMLYDGKANIPNEIREELKNDYFENLQNFISISEKEFNEYYFGYTLIRIMQALGAYGFRGFYEKKQHFLDSIPFAVRNLNYLLSNYKLPIEIPEIYSCLLRIADSPELAKYNYVLPKEFTVSVYSFAFKNGVPSDITGNGGGYVFDCRALPNPGRIDFYKTLNGKDKEVIEFFEKHSHQINNFLDPVFKLVDSSVENYKARNFKHLMVNFGCTGGQHRSVYCAEQLGKYLNNKNVNVNVYHIEQDK